MAEFIELPAPCITYLYTGRKQFNRIHKFKKHFLKVKLNSFIEFPYLHYVHSS